nr:hypothetical protein [candidate division Zixibacteria bacterium]
MNKSTILSGSNEATRIVGKKLSGSGHRLARIFSRCFSSVFKNRKNIYDLFFSLTKKLNKFFSISHAILIIHSEHDDRLKVIAMKGKKRTHLGLALTLPRQDSLLYSIFSRGIIYTRNFPVEVECNFVEKKLLFQESTNSIAVCPITSDGSVRGLICLASPILYAFSMFEDGILDGILEEFGLSLSRELDRYLI